MQIKKKIITVAKRICACVLVNFSDAELQGTRDASKLCYSAGVGIGHFLMHQNVADSILNITRLARNFHPANIYQPHVHLNPVKIIPYARVDFHN
jgi:hypothetical protein